MKLSVKTQTRVALMAAVLCVTSQISLPIGPIPMTLQTLFLALSGAVLGMFPAVATVLIYLAIGAIGVPVFAGFLGGVERLVSATGGFLWSFPVYAGLCGLFSNRKLIWQLAAGMAGLVFIDVCGTLQLMAVAGLTLEAALAAAVWPFVMKDILCTFLGIWLGRKIRPRLEGRSF